MESSINAMMMKQDLVGKLSTAQCILLWLPWSKSAWRTASSNYIRQGKAKMSSSNAPHSSMATKSCQLLSFNIQTAPKSRSMHLTACSSTTKNLGVATTLQRFACRWPNETNKAQWVSSSRMAAHWPNKPYQLQPANIISGGKGEKKQHLCDLLICFFGGWWWGKWAVNCFYFKKIESKMLPQLIDLV